jgi:hypothetical protein
LEIEIVSQSNIRFLWRVSVVAILGLAGCGDPTDQSINNVSATQPSLSEQKSAIEPRRPTTSNNVIVSDGPITIENGKVTFGHPQVTEEVERQIYKSLSYFRNLANAIEKKVPGGNAGSRQSREDYNVAATVFKSRYSLSDADLDDILRKGDKQGWK